MNKPTSLFIAIVLAFGLLNELAIRAFPRLEDGNDQAWPGFFGKNATGLNSLPLDGF